MPKSELKDINFYVAQRQNAFASVTASWDEVKGLTSADLPQLQAHHEDLTSLQEKFEKANDSINQLNCHIDVNERVDTDNAYVAFRSVANKIKAKYIQLRKEQPVTTPTPSVTVPPGTQSPFPMPQIQLPTFSGKIEEWPEFFALYQSLIHSNGFLSPIQKFHCLRANLSGEALATLSNLQMTETNYDVAINALINRYQDPRRIARAYLSKIVDFKPRNTNPLDSLKHFLITHQNSIQAIRALQIKDLSNFILLTLALQNLDPKIAKVFEERHAAQEIPKLDDLLVFVTQQIKTLELTEHTTTRATRTAAKSNAFFANAVPATASSSASKCILCKQSHSLSACTKFLQLKREEKIDLLSKHKRCFNCMGPHLRSSCTSKYACRICNSRSHHTLLHPQRKTNDVATSSSSCPKSEPSNRPISSHEGPSSSASPVSLSCTADRTFSISLLGTFRALIVDNNNCYLPVRGVIDPGSQLSFISKRLSSLLQRQIRDAPVSVTGISGKVSISPGTIQCKLLSRTSNDHIVVNPSVVPVITNHLPSVDISRQVVRAFNHLVLSDPTFGQPDHVDLLLGADVYPQLLLSEPFITSPLGPVAISTIFGWTIIGPVQNPMRNQVATSLISTCQISQDLTKFWEIENVSNTRPSDPLDALAEQSFVDTHTRDETGRYAVTLPLKPNAQPLANNQQAARASLRNLARRLDKIPTVKSEYHQFLSEYLDSGHMSIAKHPAPYIIPHHVVTKLTNQGSKIRVVFNASAPDSSGVSLNERLLKGPKLQLEIADILLSFRLPRIAICCDIRQMYRQVLVLPQDRHMQHIYWKPHPDAPVEEAELNTVTYGLAPSAFLAVRVLHQLVHDEGSPFPLASEAILHQTYVDDIITGANDIDSALALRHQLKQLLALGGFELRKWSSSHPILLRDLPSEHLESVMLFNDEDKSLKILGLHWEPTSDRFLFQAQPFQASCTKRNMLSFIARVFDPNGLIAPVTIAFKILIQKIWLAKLDWDQTVTVELESEWNQLINGLHLISSVSFPRCVVPEDKAGEIHLVGFADASSSAYASVIYICFEGNNRRQSFLWKAKTRVAPLKTITIPRLELCAALLLVDLLNSVLAIKYPRPISSIRLFSDSEIVLNWLQTPPHLLKTFVSHRVAHIVDKSPTSTIWSHISSELNPSDMASRGCSASNFIKTHAFSLWSRGPPFLNNPSEGWPPPFHPTREQCETLPELKSVVTTLAVFQPDLDFEEFSSRFSSFLRFQRVVAWMLRFARRRHSHLVSQSSSIEPLSVHELHNSLSLIIRQTQATHFYDLLQKLTKSQCTKELASLSPFLDERGLIRVGGRLKNASLPYHSRHPILLPRTAHLSRLICLHYHTSSLHSGPNTCQALIRSRYWIISLRQLLRKVIHQCKPCHLFRASTIQPIMADLPPCRVQPGRPFLTTGVDFAGPFNVRASRLRKATVTKGYLCLFVCTTTKAVHLEFASELSTDVFLAALDRFIARRSIPHTILSDQGRNFVGANKRMQEIYQFLQAHNNDICDKLSQREIIWTFNPPLAPNFGGLWEAAVKSTKALLYRLSANILFTSEEYSTLFARIEAILNSRPLCPLSADPNESSIYLSPGHFLVGAPLISRPEIPIVEGISLIDRWKTISQISQAFWRRWSREYLNTLMQRVKWNRPAKPLQQGDVVVLKGVNSSPLSWPIARIAMLKPGADGVSRVAVLDTSNGSLTRPINKIVPLPG